MPEGVHFLHEDLYNQTVVLKVNDTLVEYPLEVLPGHDRLCWRLAGVTHVSTVPVSLSKLMKRPAAAIETKKQNKHMGKKPAAADTTTENIAKKRKLPEVTTTEITTISLETKQPMTLLNIRNLGFTQQNYLIYLMLTQCYTKCP